MSWEVSSMQSKRSFFNRALFRKNLGRFWPLWGGASLAGSLAPLYLLLSLLSSPRSVPEPEDFTRLLYMTAVAVVPALTLCYAIVVAMVVWSYLYSARSVGLMHTLPIDRTGLFVTNTLSGLAMMLIPYAIVGGLLCLIALCWGFFDLMAVMNTVLAVLLMTVLFFGFATLCAMVTGHLLALPAFYFLLNFLAPALDGLVTGFAREFLLGVRDDYSGAVTFLSPVMQIYDSFSYEYESFGLEAAESVTRLHGLWVVAVYGLVGLVMLAAAWALYRARRSESAGDVVAFRWLRPVFRYGVALLSALTLGRLLYEVLWAALFQKGDYADPVPMAVCMAVTGAVGYYAASMLLEKSLRVFRGSWRGVLAVCAGVVLLCALVSMDVFGVESRIPGMDQVETVEFSGSGMEYVTLSAQTDQELVEKVLALHRAIVEDRDYIRSYDRNASAWAEESFGWTYFQFTYTLTDGTRLRRAYNLPVTQGRSEQEGAYDRLLYELYRDPGLQIKRVEIPAGGQLTGVYLYDYNDGTERETANADADALYNALFQDARSGNIRFDDPGWFEIFDDDSAAYPAEIGFEYRIVDSFGVNHRSIYTRLRPSMTNTLTALLDMGYLSETDLAYWNETLREEYGKDILIPETVSR